MEKRGGIMEFIKHHLGNIPPLPFYYAKNTKSHSAICLRQHIWSQWVAASRGLLQNTAHTSSHPLQPEDFSIGHPEEDDEMVLARLHKAQHSLQETLSRLDQDLRQLQNTFLSTRKLTAARTSFYATLVTSFLSVLVVFSRAGYIPSLPVIPLNRQPLIPFLPSIIAILLIVRRERKIAAVFAARSRVMDLRVAVELSQPVSPDDIAWLESKEWDGVDWSLVEL